MSKFAMCKVVGLTAVVLLAEAICARTSSERGDLRTLADRVRIYDLNTPLRSGTKIVAAIGEDSPVLGDRAARSSLGWAASASSPGHIVRHTYHDYQWTYSGSRIQWFGLPNLRFVYNERSWAGDKPRFGYQIYDPITGYWPRGADVGCVVQLTGNKGLDPSVGLSSKGKVVIAGADSSSASAMDNRSIYLISTPMFGCVFGSGSQIPSSQYLPGMSAPSGQLYPLIIDLQEVGGDTITHLLSSQSNFPYTIPGCPKCNRQTPLLYLRKTTFSNTGTWSGPVVLDTVDMMGHITVSRYSPKVAVMYIKITPEGVSHNNPDDKTIYYRESDSAGVTWKAAVNVTPYNRMTAQSYSPWVEAKGMYDTQNQLHIIFNGVPVPQDPYGTGFVGWDALTTGSSVLHWSSATGMISTVHNAEWDFDRYSWPDKLCGFVGENMLTTGDLAMSECNNRLYVVWAMGNDAGADTPLLNDCATGGTRGPAANANGELYMSVSNDLSGTLWDNYRNLTRTPTPGCDSAGFGGVCLSDVKPSMTISGMDVTSFDTNGIPVTLKWPDTGVNPGPGPFTGTHYTHLMYLEDHWPDQKVIDSNINKSSIRWSENAMQWMRLACVSPVLAPRLKIHTSQSDFPELIPHGRQFNLPVLLENTGNVTLNFFTSTYRQDLPGVSWLTFSVSSAAIATQPVGTLLGELRLNTGGVINSPGTIVRIRGGLVITSDSPTSPDTLTVDCYVADTAADMVWDTVTTAYLALTASNAGNMGHQGIGRANLDFFNFGDCDVTGGVLGNSEVYLFDASPIVARVTGADTSIATSLYTGQAASAQSFVPTGAPTIMAQADWTEMHTGVFTSRDGAVGVQRSYYLPLTAADGRNAFVKTKFFSADGLSHSGLTLGEAADWDIPSDYDNWNTCGVDASRRLVYQRGAENSNWQECQDNNRRFGGLALLFAKNKNGALVAPLGAFSALSDSLHITPLLGPEAGQLTRLMNTTSGYSAPSTTGDMYSVLTYLGNYLLTPPDTVEVVSVYTTVRSGTSDSVLANVDRAKNWLCVNGGRIGLPDFDVDSAADFCDNCPLTPNRTQIDNNSNGIGDACEGRTAQTPSGSSIIVQPTSYASLTFSTVATSGITEVRVDSTGAPAISGFQIQPPGRPLVYQLLTTASHGNVSVCITYDPVGLSVPESDLRLLHGTGSPITWLDITTLVDSANNRICGSTSSLSPFVIAAATGCCRQLTGNVDCDPTDLVDISDLATLIDYLYITFTPLCCEAEGNIDGQTGIDISDLSALIDYLYISFTPPAACQ